MNPTTSTRQLPGIRESLIRFGRAVGLLRPYWGSYARLLGMGLGLAIVGLIGPLLTKLLIDRVYPTGDVSLLVLLVAAMLMHSLVTNIVGAIRGYYGQVVGAHLQADTTVFMVNHLQHLPLRFFERMPVGDILSRFGDLRATLRSVAGLFDLMLQGIYVVLIPPVLLFMNWRLALLAFMTVPVTTLINIAVTRTLRRRWKLVAEASAEVQALNVETLSHIRLLKGMGLERTTFDRTAAVASDARKESLAAARLSTLLGMVTGLVRIAGTTALTYFGWLMILQGGFTLGSFLAFTAYLAMVRGPLNRVTSLISQFQKTAITVDRVFEVLEEPTEADPSQMYDNTYTPAPVDFDGEVRFESVRFEYSGGGFSLDIPELCLPKGTVTGIIGESGSGKSTLLRLISGLESPSQGLIWYGDQSHRSLPVSSVRRSVAVAWQTPEILRGSLRSNILAGVTQPSPEQLDEVIEVCQLRELVSSLPEGLDTPVSEWGVTLSGGQQQRLSLARALIRNATVVLLDEVTSNLDPSMEAAMMQQLTAYLRGTTVVLVSHRPSTIRHVDRLVKLSSGRAGIVENLRQRGRGVDPGASGDAPPVGFQHEY